MPHPPTDGATAPADASSRGRGSQPPRRVNVLVVEDHADLREMLAVLLETEGFQVQTAANGLEALQRLAEMRPSLILLDLMMPVMTGDEFRERQLADERFRQVPVICLTATHDAQARAERLQASAWFQKPIDFEQLLDAVREHTGR